MDYIRHFASSFRSVDRMGNEQSLQNAPGSDDEEDGAREKTRNVDSDHESDDTDSNYAAQSPSRTAGSVSQPTRAPSSSGLRRDKRTESRSRSGSKVSLTRRISNEIVATTDGASETESGLSPALPTQESNGGSKRMSRRPKRNKFEQQVIEAVNSLDGHDSQDDQDDPNTRERDNDTVTVSTSLISTQFGSQTNGTRYPCPQANTYDCTKTFSSRKTAKRHADAHFGNKYQCVVCDKSFSRLDTFERHQQRHTRAETQQATARLTDVADEDNEGSEFEDHGEQENEYQQVAPHIRQTRREVSEGIPRAISVGTVTTPEPTGRSSTRTSTSTTSVFDPPVYAGVVAETPRPKSRLKRNRNFLSVTQPLPHLATSPRKKRRRQSLSPSTSVASEEERTTNKRQKRDRDRDAIEPSSAPEAGGSKSKTTRTSNLDNFAKPWIPGSQLRHPIYNPQSPEVGSSQQVQVIIPRSSQAESSNRVTKSQRMFPTWSSDGPGSLQTPLIGKSRSIVYTTPKGKRKAESGVLYSSASEGRSDNQTGDDEDGDEAPEPEGMATSVARRGSSQSLPQKRPRASLVAGASIHSDPGRDEQASQSTSAAKQFVCQECGRGFATKAGLRRHEKRPNVHKSEHECSNCAQVFPTSGALRDHEKEAHQDNSTDLAGRKGAFSPTEVTKLERWREYFCEENNINISTFNQMMTDSSRRGKDHAWPYRFITKANLLQEYYDVLPERNRRSMHRYRERAFQNVPDRQEWTKKDDKELALLVKQLGPRWVEIGQRMTRTQDSVCQRWRFKLRYNGMTNQGEWLPLEEEKLREAVYQVKEESGLSHDMKPDARLSWESVSKKLDTTRTAQQCSNKWRLLNHRRKRNRFVRLSGIDRVVGSPSTIATPGKMSQRLAGQTPSSRGRGSSSRKRISKEYVQESDDNEASDIDAQSEEEGRLEDNPKLVDRIQKRHRAENEDAGSATSSDSSSEAESDVESDADTDAGVQTEPSHRQSPRGEEDGTPEKRRNPLPTKTPQTGKGLSQVFAQTQANTSALRAPDSIRRAHTQTEMPTPGIPVQHRSDSSSWLAINSKSPNRDEHRSDEQQVGEENDDAIMAEPISSDEEARQTENNRKEPAEEGASSVATSSSDSESDSDSDVQINSRRESRSRSQSSSSADSSSNRSTSPEGEDGEENGDVSDNDDMVQDTQKDSFIQSLRSPDVKSSLSSKVERSSGPRQRRSRINWAKILAGEESPTHDDSGTDDEDEGDIMHH